MGFKNLTVFNDALAFGGSSLALNPRTAFPFWSSQYFPNCDFLDASLGYSSSFSWKSIWSSKALVKEGVVWRVGNGTNINLWEDPWILDEEGHFLTSTPRDEYRFVSDLVSRETME